MRGTQIAIKASRVLLVITMTNTNFYDSESPIGALRPLVRDVLIV